MTDGAERRHQRGREGARLTVHATPAGARSPDLLPRISECECDTARENQGSILVFFAFRLKCSFDVEIGPADFSPTSDSLARCE